MKNNILYFPYINLPNNEWSIKSILYWDTVGTIVPINYLQNPNRLTKFMRDAVQTGHIVQHFTSDYEHIQQEVDEKILELIQDPAFSLQESQINFANGVTSRVHSEKFSWYFFDILISLGVAVERGEWFSVERKIAAMMMACLATAIANELDHIASTDIPIYARENNLTGLVKNTTENIRTYLLEEVMPFPIDVELNKLIKFKEKYYEELKSFRLSVDKIVWILSGIADEEAKKNLFDIEIEKINIKREELVVRLNEKKLRNIAFGAVKGVLIDTAIAIVTGNVISPVGTLLGAINEVIKQHKGNPIKNKELAYLALMEQRLK